MMSGKTTELIRRVETADIAGLDYRIFKPSIDTRYDDNAVVNHNGDEWSATVVDTAEGIVRETATSTVDIVAIDEIQFFNGDTLYESVVSLINNNVTVILAGLDTDFRGETFESTARLLAQADHVSKLKAVCAECGKPATRTQRLVDGSPAPYDSNRVVVGGTEQYEARCREHHEVPQ